MNWKPERAHHCSECGKCVFKVRQEIMLNFEDGSSLSLGKQLCWGQEHEVLPAFRALYSPSCCYVSHDDAPFFL